MKPEEMTEYIDDANTEIGSQEELLQQITSALEGKTGANNIINPPDSLVFDPDEVYRTTRPKDWLELPVPGDNEIYCLGLIWPGEESEFFVSAHTSSGSATIELGTVRDGVFTAKTSVTAASGAGTRLKAAYGDYEDETADGTRQYVARISGSFSKVDLSKSGTAIKNSNIVEIACGTVMSQLVCGSTAYAHRSLAQLRYIRFIGRGKVDTLSDAFSNCKSIMAICAENEFSTSASGYASNCFYGAPMPAIPSGLFGSALLINSTWHNSPITILPDLGARPTSMSNTFRSSALTRFTKAMIDTSRTANFSLAFYDCDSLGVIDGLDLSACTGIDNDFINRCRSLSRLIIAGETTPGGYTITLPTCPMDHAALVETINSLPTATNAATLAVTNAAGASELTDGEIAIATAKNWTITI